MRDDLTKTEQLRVGKKARLEIPLNTVSNLKRVSEVLRGLASQLDNIYHFNEDRPTVAMLRVREMVRSANQDLEKIRGRGRPKKGRQFQNGNKIW